MTRVIVQVRAAMTALVLVAHASVASVAQSADSTSGSSGRGKTFFTASDGWIALGIAGASAGLSLFDARIAKNFQDTAHMHVRVGERFDDIFTHINESTLTIGGLAVYAIARVAGAKTVATVAIHVSEAVAAASVSNQLVRGPLGRSRPRNASPPYENQYDFDFMKGFTRFENRAFPSIHSSSGFAAASVLVAEIDARSPAKLWWVAVPAYAFALTPGLSRMYLGQHWASDILAGAAVGTFYGWRIVRYSQSHGKTPIDRVLLDRRSIPIGVRFTF